MAAWTRRGFLAALPVCASAERGRIATKEGVRYPDPATDFPVERLTDPKFATVLPNPYCRAIARRGAFILCSSDRGDGMQVCRYELRAGELKQLTEAKALQPDTVTLLPDDRLFAYLDGPSLMLAPIGAREREVYRTPDPWTPGDGFNVSGDGIYAALVEKNGARSRLRLIGTAKGNATTLVEHEGELRNPQTRPRRASVLYQRDDTLCLVNYDGQNNIKLGAAIANPGSAIWSADGRTVLYLSRRDKTVTMRESTPDTQQDRLFAPTSQYANFSRNPDGSVMVAASQSVAAPYILIMVKAVKRELALCEHKSSDGARVCPIFSPTSQRIYFGSDRHGKPAIYSMVVDKLTEKTETDVG